MIINCSGRGDKDVQELAAWEERQKQSSSQ